MSMFAIIVIFVLLLLLVIFLTKGLVVQKMPKVGGDAGIIDAKGQCVKKYSEKEGKIFVKGEFWEARFREPVEEGDMVVVLNVVDTKAIVRRMKESEENVY